MKVAHVAIVTPRRCGLYETTRELVAAERDLGIDAAIVDPKPHPAFQDVGPEDRGAPIRDMEWAKTADLIVSHSGHDGTPLADTDQPILQAAHGRPVSTWIMEREGGAPAWTYHGVRSQRERYRGCVTFWPEYEAYFQAMWGDKPVHVVPPTVDLDYWCPDDTDYDFAGQAGEYNVVMTDPWCRRDVVPMPLILAFHRFRQSVPQAKLHIFAMDENHKGLAWVKRLLGDGLGIIQRWAADLRPVYRKADMLISPQRIYTRSIREAMACGAQVVSAKDADPADIIAFARSMEVRVEFPLDTRHRARMSFCPERAARVMRSVMQQHALEEAVA